MNIKLILALLLAGLVILFIVQNVAAVEIQFLVWSAHISRALLLFIILAIGIGIGWALNSLTAHAKKKKK